MNGGESVHPEPVSLMMLAYLNFLRNISTSQQSFECTLTLQFQWCQAVPVEQVSGWVPDVLLENAIGELQVHNSNTVHRAVTQYETLSTHTITFNGEFAERLELKQFPIDCQRLHIHVSLVNCPSSSSSQAKGTKFALEKGSNGFCFNNFIDSDSWTLVEAFDTSLITTDNMLLDSQPICKAILHLAVQRCPQYYFWNIVLPISMQAMLALLTILLACDDLSTKATLTLTIILTIFAVKFSCLQYIPVINCVTYLDMFLIHSTTFVCLVLAQNIVVFLIDPESAITFNRVSGIILACMWLMTNAFVFSVFMSRRIRNLFIRQQLEDDQALHMRQTPSSVV